MCDIAKSMVIGQSSTKILDANETRSGMFIRNMSNNATISIGFTHAAEINKGVTLFPKETFSMGINDYCADEIYIVSDKDNTLVAYQEFWYRSRYNW
jgi:hypothetical protein